MKRNSVRAASICERLLRVLIRRNQLTVAPGEAHSGVNRGARVSGADNYLTLPSAVRVPTSSSPLPQNYYRESAMNVTALHWPLTTEQLAESGGLIALAPTLPRVDTLAARAVLLQAGLRVGSACWYQSLSPSSDCC